MDHRPVRVRTDRLLGIHRNFSTAGMSPYCCLQSAGLRVRCVLIAHGIFTSMICACLFQRCNMRPRSQYKERFGTPRQPTVTVHVAGSGAQEGSICLAPGLGLEHALCSLEGFDYCWVIAHMHVNTGWKPLVSLAHRTLWKPLISSAPFHLR